MRVPVLLLLSLAFLLPATQAGSITEADGKWYWEVRGTVGVTGFPGVAGQGRFFVGEGGEYFWRVTFAPSLLSVECASGAGRMWVSGAAVPLESCSLGFNGAYAIPRAAVLSTDLGQLPGSTGGYLGDLHELLAGSGSFRLA